MRPISWAHRRTLATASSIVYGFARGILGQAPASCPVRCTRSEAVEGAIDGVACLVLADHAGVAKSVPHAGRNVRMGGRRAAAVLNAGGHRVDAPTAGTRPSSAGDRGRRHTREALRTPRRPRNDRSCRRGARRSRHRRPRREVPWSGSRSILLRATVGLWNRAEARAREARGGPPGTPRSLVNAAGSQRPHAAQPPQPVPCHATSGDHRQHVRRQLLVRGAPRTGARDRASRSPPRRSRIRRVGTGVCVWPPVHDTTITRFSSSRCSERHPRAWSMERTDLQALFRC